MVTVDGILFADLHVERMRFEAVRCMAKSYRPTVPVSYISKVLRFSRKTPLEESPTKLADGRVECEDWLKAHGVVLIMDSNGESLMDTKVSQCYPLYSVT